MTAQDFHGLTTRKSSIGESTEVGGCAISITVAASSQAVPVRLKRHSDQGIRPSCAFSSFLPLLSHFSQVACWPKMGSLPS
ncbi:MAG: hypothetical protein MNPFHGCM_00002 [Gemmatimonadaceae bacterium]|nr:hypothetical protein [Gemmatimonadaceae bacterium]